MLVKEATDNDTYHQFYMTFDRVHWTIPHISNHNRFLISLMRNNKDFLIELHWNEFGRQGFTMWGPYLTYFYLMVIDWTCGFHYPRKFIQDMDRSTHTLPLIALLPFDCIIVKWMLRLRCSTETKMMTSNIDLQKITYWIQIELL